MAKRIEKIKKIQKALLEIMSGTNKLISISKMIEDKKFKQEMDLFALSYTVLNYKFAMNLLVKIPHYYGKDKTDKAFNKLMKPLENELRKRDNDK